MRLATAILRVLSSNAELPLASMAMADLVYLLPECLSIATSIPTLPEESDVLKDPIIDLDILVDVDAVQANDELLGTTVKAALEQSNPDWSRVTEFLIKTIRNRVPWPDSEIADGGWSLENKASLSRRFTESVMEIFLLYIAPHSKDVSDSMRSKDRLGHALRAVSVFVAIAETTSLDSRLSANLHHVFVEWLATLSHITEIQGGNGHLIWRCMLPVACKMYEDEGSGFVEKKLELLQLVLIFMQVVSVNLTYRSRQNRMVFERPYKPEHIRELEHKCELWVLLNDSKKMLIQDTAISLLRHITIQSPSVNSGILHSVIINLCGAARVSIQRDKHKLRGSVHVALSKNTKMDWDIPTIKTILQSWISQHPDYTSVYCGVKDVCSTTGEFSPGIPLMVNDQNIEMFVSAIEETARSVSGLTQAVNLCLVTLECRRRMGHHPAFYHDRPRRSTFEILAIMLKRLRSFQRWPQEGVPSAYPDYMNLAKRAVELITMIDDLSHFTMPNSSPGYFVSVWKGPDFRSIFVKFCGAPLYYAIFWKTMVKLRRINSHPR
jgi:hypothetical protein